ncbi:hypothetical protein AMECASPLE_017895 [Ameca splendens]|uniref:Uncharacterized protein n=1 Tax=Ameca splendens TaxID=208324 RepID=A0ABV0ZME5_9TELE
MATGVQNPAFRHAHLGMNGSLGKFGRRTVTGCHQRNKSVHYISSLLNIPQSTINYNTGKTISNNRNGGWKMQSGGTLHVDVHSVQRSPSVCRFNSYTLNVTFR